MFPDGLTRESLLDRHVDDAVRAARSVVSTLKTAWGFIGRRADRNPATLVTLPCPSAGASLAASFTEESRHERALYWRLPLRRDPL
jgi:hypothetical protein